MIQQDEGVWWVSCDGTNCVEVHDLDALSFWEAVEEVKAIGWRITKEDGEWVHLCTLCDSDRSTT